MPKNLNIDIVLKCDFVPGAAINLVNILVFIQILIHLTTRLI